MAPGVCSHTRCVGHFGVVLFSIIILQANGTWFLLKFVASFALWTPAFSTSLWWSYLLSICCCRGLHLARDGPSPRVHGAVLVHKKAASIFDVSSKACYRLAPVRCSTVGPSHAPRPPRAPERDPEPLWTRNERVLLPSASCRREYHDTLPRSYQMDL